MKETAKSVMNILKKLTTIQPTDITPGPPVARPYEKRLEVLSTMGDAQVLQSYVVMPVITLYRVLDYFTTYLS